MSNPKKNNNHWDNQGKGKESFDSNNQNNSRGNEGGRPPKYAKNEIAERLAKNLKDAKSKE
jgi:hypothetical protein